MAYNHEELTFLLFKKLAAGKATSKNSTGAGAKAYYEESENSKMSILNEQI